MRLQKITKEQALQIMETVNPLGLTDCNGRLVIFESAAGCYECLLKELFRAFPRGYIDIPLAMRKYQSLRLFEGRENCKHREYALVIWYNMDNKRDYLLKKLVMCFLEKTGCPFSENAFKQAIFELNAEVKHYYSQKQ